MKISPEALIEENKNKSYEELLALRDELVTKITQFEAEHDIDPEDVVVHPLQDGNYYCNLRLLAGVCNLIAEKFSE